MFENNKRTQESSPISDRTQSPKDAHQFEKPLRRKYTNSPLRSSTPVNALFRASSFLSEMDDGSQVRWTRQHWKLLEEYYVRKDRDYEKAATAFYYCESLIHMPETEEGDQKRKELWPLEKILWRCKCLDTRARYQKESFNRKRHKTLSESGSFSISEKVKSSQTDSEQ